MPIDYLTAPERETIINTTDADDTIRIWTAQRTVITSLRKKPDSFIEIGSGSHGSTEWAEFEIPVREVNFGALAKRRGTPRPHLARREQVASTTVSAGREEAA